MCWALDRVICLSRGRARIKDCRAVLAGLTGALDVAADHCGNPAACIRQYDGMGWPTALDLWAVAEVRAFRVFCALFLTLGTLMAFVGK